MQLIFGKIDMNSNKFRNMNDCETTCVCVGGGGGGGGWCFSRVFVFGGSCMHYYWRHFTFEPPHVTAISLLFVSGKYARFLRSEKTFHVFVDLLAIIYSH